MARVFGASGNTTPAPSSGRSSAGGGSRVEWGTAVAPNAVSVPTSVSFADTAQGQKYRKTFSESTPEYQGYLVDQLSKRAKSGDKKAYDQLLALKGLTGEQANPIKTAGTFGDKGIGRVFSGASDFAKAQVKGVVEPLLGTGTAGENVQRDASGKVTQVKAGHEMSNLDSAIAGIQARLLFGAPGAEQAEQYIAGKVGGAAGRIIGGSVNNAINFGASGAVGQQTDENRVKDFGQQVRNTLKAAGEGAVTGAVIGGVTKGVGEAVGAVKTARTPVNDATIANIGRTKLEDAITSLEQPKVKPTEPISVAPKAPTKPEYTAVVSDGNGGKVQKAVKGAPVKTYDGLDTFIHRDTLEGKTWVVSEKSTGLQVGKGKTQALAVADAKANIDKAGLEQTKSLVAQKQMETPLTKFDTPEIIKARAEQAKIPSTHLDTSPERQALRENVIKTLDEQGGRAKAEGRPTKIAQNRRADIVIGPPAAGKSTVFADPLALEHNSRLIDSDEAKKLLGSGKHAGALHIESDQIKQALLDKALGRGENIVVPIVGKSLSSITDHIDALTEAGYDVHLHLNHVSPEIAASRAIQRYTDTGRFLDPNYILNDVGLNPIDNYGIITKEGSPYEQKLKSYDAKHNEVAPGEEPVVLSGVRQKPDNAGSVRGTNELGDNTQASQNGVTLQSTAIPGAAEFAQHDVIPAVKNLVGATKQIAEEAKAVLTPASISERAKETAQLVSEYKATGKNEAALNAARGAKAEKYFNARSDAENITNISNYERTGQFASAPKGMTVEEYSKLYKETTDAAHQLKVEAFGKNDVGYIDFYVRRAGVFDFKNPELEGEAVKALSTTYSLKPRDGSNLHRSLDMPLDEALRTLDARGLKLGKDFKLTTTNPETLRQLTINSATQAKAYSDLGKSLKEQDLIKFVKGGGNIPEGRVPLNDRAFQVFFPSEAGMVRAGQYFATQDVARILDNATSQGLEKSALFRGLRTIKNNFNLVQLGLSAYHAGTTTINASLNDVVVGFRDIIGGHPLTGTKEVVRGAIPGVSAIRDVYLGSKAFKAFKEASPEAAKVLEESINPSGFRLKSEEAGNQKLTNSMIKHFANGNWLGGALRIPGAAIEQSMRPVMEHLVPNVKLQSMLDRAEQLQRVHPNATDAELKALLTKSSASMDNIYGQMVYDNVFWNKTFKDMAMLSQRSVGWNLGTIREVGGGILDLKKIPTEGISDRTLFAGALPLLVGTYGAAYQYLHTGKGPTEFIDYFYPKNGLTDKDGNPERVSLPSYMKDVFAYGKDPISTLSHKASPLISIFTELGTNENYYGDMIRNPDDPASKQFEQVGKYLLNNFIPFSIQSQQKVKATGGNALKQAESFIGINKAPKDITTSKFEKNVYDSLDKQLNTGPRTPEQQDTSVAKARAREQIKSGQGSSLTDELIRQGVIKADRAKQFKADAEQTSLRRAFDALSYVNQAKVLEGASPDDIARLGNTREVILRAQKAYHNKNANPETRDAAKKIVIRLGGTP